MLRQFLGCRVYDGEFAEAGVPECFPDHPALADTRFALQRQREQRTGGGPVDIVPEPAEL
jgi:hypothetical protein